MFEWRVLLFKAGSGSFVSRVLLTDNIFFMDRNYVQVLCTDICNSNHTRGKLEVTNILPSHLGPVLRLHNPDFLGSRQAW